MATAEEIRRAREETSVFAPLFEYARSNRSQLASEGRRPVLGGLLSKEPVMGTDTLRYEGVGSLFANLLDPIARGVDAPRAAAQDLIPQEDMVGEAFGTAGTAMLGGGAVAKPAGSLGMNVLRDTPLEGFEGYLSRVNPSGKRIAAEDRPNLMMGDMYGMLPRNSDVIGEKGGVTFYRSPDGDYYATAYNPDVGEQDVVGYITDRGDSTELQVVAEMQGQGIGGELQYLFRSENPDAPTGGLTEAGERALERTYDRMFDEGLVSANASKSAGLLSVASDVSARGDQILNMLKSGRGPEVTDAMLDMGDSVKNTQLNQYLAANYDLPMDEASRLARAREIGFNVDDVQYHGTAPSMYSDDDFSPDITAFIPGVKGQLGAGVYVAPDVRKANKFASAGEVNRGDFDPNKAVPRGGSVLPVYIRSPNPASYGEMRNAQYGLENVSGFNDLSMRGTQALSDEGFTGVRTGNEENVFDPNNIRSTNARFDPRLSELENIMAANASPISGLLAQSGVSSEQAQRIEDYLLKTGLLQ
jgi:hypothetical protein